MKKNNELKACGFIALTRDGFAIMAIGKTPVEALEYVKENCGPFRNESGDEVASGADLEAAIARDFYIQPATQALLDQVQSEGGAITWGNVDGIACTEEEEILYLSASSGE